MGALPLAYTEQFAQRESHGRDGTARAFLDIFQHRAVSLFHDAWRKHRMPLQFEAERRERYLPLVLSLIGLGEPSLRRRLHADRGGVADAALAYYAGLLQRRATSADHLQKVLADYFGVPVRVAQFIGRWFELDDDCQVTLGGCGAELGRNTVLGPRVWQRDLCARIGIGPMTRAQHRRFLPGGPAALALHELLSLVNGVGIEYEVCLGLRAADIAGIRLGSPEPADGGACLGWDTYLISGTCGEDREDAAYKLHSLAA
jgi:type VI secretion system protein ImpH